MWYGIRSEPDFMLRIPAEKLLPLLMTTLTVAPLLHWSAELPTAGGVGAARNAAIVPNAMSVTEPEALHVDCTFAVTLTVCGKEPAAIAGEAATAAAAPIASAVDLTVQAFISVSLSLMDDTSPAHRPSWPSSARSVRAKATAVPLQQSGVVPGAVACRRPLVPYSGSGAAPRPTRSSSPRRLALRRRRDLVDRQVRAVELLLRVEPQADCLLQDAVDEQRARDGDAGERPDELRAERHAADAAERLRSEDAGGEPAPRAAEAVQRPDAEH